MPRCLQRFSRHDVTSCDKAHKNTTLWFVRAGIRSLANAISDQSHKPTCMTASEIVSAHEFIFENVCQSHTVANMFYISKRHAAGERSHQVNSIAACFASSLWFPQENDDGRTRTFWRCNNCPMHVQGTNGQCNQAKFRKEIGISYVSEDKVSSLLYKIIRCACIKHCALLSAREKDTELVTNHNFVTQTQM